MDAGSIPLELATIDDISKELRRRGSAVIVGLVREFNPDDHLSPQRASHWMDWHFKGDADQLEVLSQRIAHVIKAS